MKGDVGQAKATDVAGLYNRVASRMAPLAPLSSPTSANASLISPRLRPESTSWMSGRDEARSYFLRPPAWAQVARSRVLMWLR
jgi:hypothetical protein